MRNSRIYTCHLQNELHVPGICSFINYNTVSTVHLWGDFRQQEQRNCQRTKGMRRQERWEGIWLLPPSACPSFSLLHAQPPADLHHQESRRGHAFISLLNGGLLSVIRCGDEAVLGLPLWSPLSMAGEGPLGERGRQGGGGLGFCIWD